MIGERSQEEILSQKIGELTKAMAYMDSDDAYITSNTIKRLQHKLNDIQGVENACDITDDGSCLSCSG